MLMTSVFAKTLKAVAEIVAFSSGKPWEAAKGAVARVVDLAGEMNLRFERGAAEAFVARVGVDSRSLMSELAKMRDYLGPKSHTITAADVAEVSSQGVGVEPEVWSVTDAIGARKPDAALEALSRFEGENGFAVMATTVIEKLFRQLAELKDAQARGVLAEATEGMNPWAAKKTVAFLGNWGLQELRTARARFMALRERSVSSAASVDALVTTELLRVMRRR
jgi:DNA polymerase III delta subunit